MTTIAETNKPPFTRNYVTVPDMGFLANIGRCASSSLTLAVVTAYYPAGLQLITPIDYDPTVPNPAGQIWYPDGFDHTNTPAAKSWLLDNKLMVPTPTGTVYAVVRDPAARFAASLTTYGITDPADVAIALEQLQAGQLENIYEFASQTPYLTSGQPTKLYNFDTDLDQFASDLGLGTLPNISLTLNNKKVQLNQAAPVTASLTDEQTTAVQTYYAPDVAILNALASPGQLYTS